MNPPFILYVRDPGRSRAFYSAVLEREPVLDVPGKTEFTLGGDASLGLMPEAGIRRLLGPALPDPAPANGIPHAEIYLRVTDAVGACARAGFEPGIRKRGSPSMSRDIRIAARANGRGARLGTGRRRR